MNRIAKISALTVGLILLVTIDMFAGTVLIHRRNKGWFGYKYIIHKPTEQTDRLDCIDPGMKSCAFPELSGSDFPLDVLNSYLAQVEQAIDEGTQNGSMNWSGVSATWSTSGSEQTVIEFNLPD